MPKKKNRLEELARELEGRKEGPNSLLAFTKFTHPKWETSEHNIKLCKYLEILEALEECPYCGEILSALGVFAPPRHGKTEIVSRRFPAWCMGRNPIWEMICAMATGQLAMDTGSNVRGIIRSPEFKRVFPNVYLQEKAQAAGRFLSNHGGIYYAAGVDGTIVGRGANFLDLDDLHGGRAAADSQRMRDIVGNWYFAEALLRLMPPGRQLLTLTRWHEDDIAGRVLPHKKTWVATEDPQFFCTPSWHILQLRAIEYADTPNAKALWPGRYPLDMLYKRRDLLYEKGRGREWESQYQQNPVVEQGTFIKRDWFTERWAFVPQNYNVYISTDFAVTASNKARDPDRTEIGVFLVGDDDKVYIVDWVTLITTSDVWAKALVDKILEWRPAVVFGEKGIIKNAVEPIIKREMRINNAEAYFEWLPVGSGDKRARGRPFQAWCSSGRVILPENEPWVEQWISEIISVGGGGRYDDKFDVCGLLFQAIEDHHTSILRPSVNERIKRDTWIPMTIETDSWRTS